MRIFPVIFCFGLFVSSSYSINYMNSLSFHGGNYKVHWTFNNETKTFYFKVEVNATGWVAFGVSRLMYPTNPYLQWNFHAMEYYDVIVGGVFSGNSAKYFKVRVLLLKGFRFGSSSTAAVNWDRLRQIVLFS